MKKFLAIVMCLAMALSMMTVVSFAANPTFGVEDVTIDAGTTTATVRVYIENNPGITALQLNVGYPEELTLAAKATNLKLFSEGAVTADGSTASNPYGWNWSWDTDDAFENGYMYSLTFNVPADAVPGTVYPLTIDYDPANVYNVDIEEVAFDKINGSITIAGEVVTEPTVEETFVDTDPVDGQPSYLCVLQPVGEFTRMGIKCDGYDTFWALADNDGNYAKTTAAVQVIGIKDATFTTVIEK